MKRVMIISIWQRYLTGEDAQEKRANASLR